LCDDAPCACSCSEAHDGADGDDPDDDGDEVSRPPRSPGSCGGDDADADVRPQSQRRDSCVDDADAAFASRPSIDATAA
jgi:hypothetical protein